MKASCIFCTFVQHKKGSKNQRYPFKILHETGHTLSFLSIDFPATEDGHVLIIPKRHYENQEDIPKYIMHDLIDHATLITKALKEKNEGTNMLVNNGKAAGQYIFHTHIHIVPRNKNDKITIEQWKRKKLSTQEFLTLHNTVKRAITHAQ